MSRKDWDKKSLPYTLAFRLPASFRYYLGNCQQKLVKVCNSFEPLAQAHLTIKFLGYSSDFLTEERVISLLPQIRSIADKFLPIKLYFRGFDTFSYEDDCKTVIFLKVLPNMQLTELHKEICKSFPEFEEFPHADENNFLPHITLSKDLRGDRTGKIHRIISRSHKMGKRHLKVDDLVVMTPYRLYPVSQQITPSLICPPPDN